MVSIKNLENQEFYALVWEQKLTLKKGGVAVEA